jgi:hypothetical protein
MVIKQRRIERKVWQNKLFNSLAEVLAPTNWSETMLLGLRDKSNNRHFFNILMIG